MNRLMNSSMLGLAPIAPTADAHQRARQERPANEKDEISPPVIERMATREEIARIREELNARDTGHTKHAHWCSVLLRATWRRIRPTGQKIDGRRFTDRNYANRTAGFRKLDCAWTDVASPVALCPERRRDVPVTAAVAVEVASDVAAVESGNDRLMCGR